MNKNKILDIILSKNEYTEEEQEVIKQIRNSIIEMEVARNSLNNVSDNKLIDICLHKEDEAKSRYSYFLAQAREMGIKISTGSMIEELNYGSKW